MKTQIISLDKFDDIDSVRDKMLWSKSARMLLVFPKRGRILRRALDLALLQRTASELGGQVALVTNDRVVTDLASEMGIPVFSQVADAQQSVWHSPDHPHPDDTRAEQRLDRQGHRQQKAALNPGKSTLNTPWVRVLAFIAGVFSVTTLVLFFMPTVKITLHPKVQTQSQLIEVFATSEIASPNVNGGIPIKQVTTILELHGEAASTGMVRFPTKAAVATVIFTNLTEMPIRVPSGTVLLALETPPVRYKVLNTVDIPGSVGATAEAQVEALQQGSVGNVPAGAITAFEGALGTQLSVENPLPAEGGEDENSPTPSEADVQMLRDALLGGVSRSAQTEFSSLMSEGMALIIDSIKTEELVDEKVEPAVGMPADRLQMTLRVRVSGWAYSNADLQQVAMLGLNANLPDGYEPIDQGVTFQNDSLPIWENQIGRWKISATRQIIPQLGKVVNPSKLIGMKVSDSVNYLANAADWELAPELNIRPSGWQWMPFLPFQYNIEVMP